MHVLIIPNAFPDPKQPYRGIFFLRQADALSAAGIKVGMLVPDVRSFKEITDPATLLRLKRIKKISRNGVRIFKKTAVNITPGSSKFHAYIYPKLVDQLFEKYVQKHGNPDIIHAHVTLYAGMAAMKLSEKTNIPYIITEHSSGYSRDLYSDKELKLSREIWVKSAAVIAVGEKLKDSMNRIAPDIKISVIPNMVNTDIFTPAPSAKQENVLFSLGNLNKNKGFDVLIRAFAKSLQSYPELILKIGGDGPERKALEQLATDLNIKEKVYFLGILEQDEIVKQLQSSWAFILTSRIETFGVAYLEAMSAGLPVIATRSGGPDKFVKPFNGILCNVNDIDDICNAIIKMNENYDSYDQNRIRKYIVDHFSEQVVVENIISVYQNILH